MAAYVIATVTITDPSWLQDYAVNVAKMLEEYGGKYHVRSMGTEQLEGDGPAPSSVVVIEFPSMEKARAWYNSDDYAPFITARQAGSTGSLLLVEGI